jgi:hypothetical protein
MGESLCQLVVIALCQMSMLVPTWCSDRVAVLDG